MPEDDRDLVSRSLDGDSDAFAKLVQNYQQLVFNIIYHYLGPSADVEDLAQDVFLRVYRSLDRIDLGRPLKQWIGRIAANRCLDELRRRKVRKVHLFGDLEMEDRERILETYEGSNQQRSLSRQEAESCLNLLHEAMEDLSAKDRMAFVLREVESIEYPELAEMLNTSEVAARIRVSRARKKLRRKLEKILYGQAEVK
ncbi:MAG TPA: sigma-70 family RNA polymerase sigma factor [Acidobacteriota bacterium]|nr:sigma-70 family RNA polymerase sigma factor [Acidobacteriota bacterium]